LLLNQIPIQNPGTDGSIFAPFVTSDRTLRIFSEELCRSLYLTYQKDIEQHGIPGYRFSLPKELLQRGSVNEDNKCFCENIGVKEGGPPTEEAKEKSLKPLDDDDFDVFGDDDEEVKVVEIPTTVAPADDDGPKECRAGVILLSACKGGKVPKLIHSFRLFKESSQSHLSFLDI